MGFKRFFLVFTSVLLLTSHFGILTANSQYASAIDVVEQTQAEQQTELETKEKPVKESGKNAVNLDDILNSIDEKVPESETKSKDILTEEEREQLDKDLTEFEKLNLFSSLKYKFHKTFIEDNRWKEFVKGLRNTILIALGATIIGVFIGLIIAITKVSKDMMDKPSIILSFFNFVFNIYTTVIRGTPALVQIIIFYFIIMSKSENYILSAMLTFGINSGAYVSEIVRGGINSIDRGQFEAGRSLGLSHTTTMTFIVIPQAVKNILPSIGNEFILLLKDTSLASYIGAHELMKAAETVSGRTFDVLFPYISVALIYLVMVIGLEQLFKYMERRLAKSDRH